MVSGRTPATLNDVRHVILLLHHVQCLRLKLVTLQVGVVEQGAFLASVGVIHKVPRIQGRCSQRMAAETKSECEQGTYLAEHCESLGCFSHFSDCCFAWHAALLFISAAAAGGAGAAPRLIEYFAPSARE